jgi:hypothetical protein
MRQVGATGTKIDRYSQELNESVTISSYRYSAVFVTKTDVIRNF